MKRVRINGHGPSRRAGNPVARPFPYRGLHGLDTGLDRFAELASVAGPHALYLAGRAYPEGTEWPDGDRLFRVGRLRRKHAVPDSDWGAV